MGTSRSLAVLIACIALGSGLAVSTYFVFGHTWDEPEHIAAGLALVDTGNYPYDTQHPPLARIAMAIGPKLAGAHSYGNPGPSGEQEGRDILYASGHYNLYLALARIGMLPFYALLLAVTWLWTRRSFGRAEAAAAVFFLTTIPTVIGHAAVAALDVPMAATTMFALYALTRWFDTRRFKDAMLFGFAAGVAAATKLSAPPFVICAAAAWFIASILAPDRGPRIPLGSVIGHASAAITLALVVLVFSYGFAFEPMTAKVPIPVPVGFSRIFDSLLTLANHNTGGHLSFFMGELRRSGWWDFYLVALGVKTPLPTLILGVIGLAWLLARAWKERYWMVAAPALAFAAMLLFASAFSHINIGVRHVMILFPLLAMGAGIAAIALWRRFSEPAWRVALVASMAAQLTSLALAHPDDLAYFNVLAGSHPENILVDSDLDWGQDMRRLEQELRARDIKDFALVYRGTADLPHENLPHYRRLWPGDRATGWIAVSLLAKATGSENGGYDWLDAYQPVTRVGKSIDLYYVPSN